MKETVKRVLAATCLSHFPGEAPRPTSLPYEPLDFIPYGPVDTRGLPNLVSSRIGSYWGVAGC